MALPKKGSRTIVVDGVSYRWRMIPTNFGPGTIAVSGLGRNAAVLRFTGGYFLRGQPTQNATPAHVAAIIRYGIYKGWSAHGSQPMVLHNDGQWAAPPEYKGSETTPSPNELKAYGFRVVSADVL